MTRTDSERDPKRPGYRGTLPERDDRLARTWLIVVGVIFVAIMVLAVLGIPSRFFPEPTPVPTPSPSATESSSPSASPSGSAAATGSASPTGSGSPSP